MTASPRVAAARAEAEAARADLVATLAELQTRLSPREVARNALDAARDRGEDLAERGVEFARERPGAAASVAAAAVALLVHRPILRGVRGLFTSRGAEPADGRVPTALPALAASAKTIPSQETSL